jgi:hypothetical protein
MESSLVGGRDPRDTTVIVGSDYESHATLTESQADRPQRITECLSAGSLNPMTQMLQIIYPATFQRGR